MWVRLRRRYIEKRRRQCSSRERLAQSCDALIFTVVTEVCPIGHRPTGRPSGLPEVPASRLRRRDSHRVGGLSDTAQSFWPAGRFRRLPINTWYGEPRRELRERFAAGGRHG